MQYKLLSAKGAFMSRTETLQRPTETETLIPPQRITDSLGELAIGQLVSKFSEVELQEIEAILEDIDAIITPDEKKDFVPKLGPGEFDLIRAQSGLTKIAKLSGYLVLGPQRPLRTR
jgi:hypothetical protein